MLKNIIFKFNTQDIVFSSASCVCACDGVRMRVQFEFDLECDRWRWRAGCDANRKRTAKDFNQLLSLPLNLGWGRQLGSRSVAVASSRPATIEKPAMASRENKGLLTDLPGQAFVLAIRTITLDEVGNCSLAASLKSGWISRVLRNIKDTFYSTALKNDNIII